MLENNTSPFEFYNYPVDINITIHELGGKYVADVRVSGMKTQSFRIERMERDIETINVDLQQAIEKVSNSRRQNSLCSEALSQLAIAGKSAFNTLFKEGTPREIILKALSAIKMKQGATIEIASENFLIPWELLYHGSLDEEVDVMCFWGMQYVISSTILQVGHPSDMVSPEIHSLRPQVGLLAYNRLKHVAGKEIPLLQELNKEEQILLFTLRELKTNQRKEDLKYLRDFLCEKDLHIVHLACHAKEKNPISQSYLLVSDNFSITMQEFFAREFKVKYNPLIILNACRTGIISSLYTYNWATLFWEYGARGVIATEFRVPDQFAADFIEVLYKHLLSGSPIGESLWVTRCYFWNQQKNPLGLAYALYSPLAVRIVNSN